jgi:DNA-binding transcriptional ArsR family regulator
MYDSDIAAVAALLADRARAAMLNTLLDGRPLTAGELARVGGVTAQTASGHLARLLDGGMVTVVKQGRHRYYSLSGPEVAQVIEALSRISPPVPVRSLRQSRQARALRQARTCYDHLAGQAGVLLFTALVDGGLIEPSGGEAYELTAKGAEVMAGLGLDVGGLRKRRRFAGACLDWTERRSHLNGALGVALAARMIELDWFRHGPVRRGLLLTAEGRRGLQDSFGCLIPAGEATGTLEV